MFRRPSSTTANTPQPEPSESSTRATSPRQEHVNNTNHGNGTFNNVNGQQTNNNGPTHNGDTYAGDYFAGNIQGGNVGGHGNSNAIYNHARPYTPQRDAKPKPASRPELQELQTRVDSLQSEIDQIMGEMGWTEEEKLRKTIKELEYVCENLQREKARSTRSRA
ncbi:hypothetical protein AB1N83_001440 [Pleurotus pulmonarius]|nr:hypothetical protein EYR36_004230 [Pleurotus pulmonarius]KAF4579340.1 hypothetical protein EYR36_001150 [Pleurotus pulmonarius]KAF4603327.1 hypothetical protein EYR38_003740 [Pleurotus pulmonarius]